MDKYLNTGYNFMNNILNDLKAVFRNVLETNAGIHTD